MKPEYLDAIVDSALFYPCCGDDLEVPLRLFASAVSNFFFVDLEIMPLLPHISDIAGLKTQSQLTSEADTYIHRATGRQFCVHRRLGDGGAAVAELHKLGVFFFRGDNPVNGEGSSGVLWLGGELLPRVLNLLVPGGLVVTDGSNGGVGGPTQFSTYYHNYEIGSAAVSATIPFEYQGRKFTCIGYAGEKYGPTLIWQVT